MTTEEQSDISSLSRCLTAVRRFFTFLFSHIGLLALVMGYCILGGLTFEHLERENEIQVKLSESFKYQHEIISKGQEGHGTPPGRAR